MGFFDKIFGKPEKQNPQTEVRKLVEFSVEQPCKSENELLERFGGIVLERQLDFGEMVSDKVWSIDVESMRISFGEEMLFPMQILGTFSHSSETWLWIWENENSDFPKDLMTNALALKKYGEENEIPILANAQFDFSKDELHLMGIFALGICEADAYYLADYGDGVMLVSITDEAVKQNRKDEPQRVVSVFSQLISLFDFDHKNALKSYLYWKGFQMEKAEQKIFATKENFQIKADFDKEGYLVEIEGNKD